MFTTAMLKSPTLVNKLTHWPNWPSPKGKATYSMANNPRLPSQLFIFPTYSNSIPHMAAKVHVCQENRGKCIRTGRGTTWFASCKFFKLSSPSQVTLRWNKYSLPLHWLKKSGLGVKIFYAYKSPNEWYQRESNQLSLKVINVIC